MPNRLADETSPYLRQHADNPVDWRPWGEDAFAEARRRDVPIFLSVGYSTCYWCHVMERESFEDAGVAAVMNEHFVNVKIDREERPDVDALYMTAVQVQTRQGGWPMSCFLTPDLRYFYGGTYFPPRDAHGRPGFTTLLNAVGEHWRTGRGEALATAEQMAEILEKLAVPPRPGRALVLDEAAALELERRSRADFDPARGGFGGAPKFPRQTLLLAALAAERAAPDENRRRQLTATLNAMAAGGIRDHLGGGFHRYSTDAKWLVPHFEVMLYDQATLAQSYAEAAELFGDDGYQAVARGVCDFVIREMSAETGGFVAALDAEVDGREGQNYLWTPAQVRDVLGDDADAFLDAYGLSGGFNFADPHHSDGRPHANVLFAAGDWRATLADERLENHRKKLKSARDERKQPHVDGKIITSWNGLMIGALATMGEPKYAEAAARAADYLLENHRKPGGLARTSLAGDARHDGLLDDHAHLAAGLLDLHDATGQARWRDAAAELFADLQQKFADPAGGGHFFSAASADDLLVRQKIGTDSPLPAGAAVAADVARRLGHADVSAATIRCFAGPLHDHPGGSSALVQAALAHAREIGPIEVAAGAPADAPPPSPRALAEAAVQVRGRWADDRTLALTLHVADGHHLNAPDAADGLVPTTLHCEGATATLPPGDQLRGEIATTLAFAQPPGEVEVALTYQACTDTECLPPITRTLHVNPANCAGNDPAAGGCGEGCGCVSQPDAV